MSISKPAITNIWGEATPGNIASPGGVNDTGWTASSASPPYQWMNWALNKIEKTVRYLLGRGIPDWDPAEDYTPGDRAQSGGHTFGCYLAAPHGSAAPTLSISDPHWAQWGHNSDELSAAISGFFAANFPTAFVSAFVSAFNSAFAAKQSIVTLTPGTDISIDATGPYASVGGYMVTTGVVTEIIVSFSCPYNSPAPVVTLSGVAAAAILGKGCFPTCNALPNTVPDNYTLMVQQVAGDATHVNFNFRFPEGISLGHVYFGSARFLVA